LNPDAVKPDAVRIVAYNEEFGTFPRRIVCVFEASNPGMRGWTEIMTAATKSGPEAPDERIKFINDRPLMRS
jgi:hypothetical protein